MKPVQQSLADRWPFFRDNGKDDGIADEAVGHDTMLAEHALSDGAELGDGALALDISGIALELHSKSAPRVEGVREHC